MLLSELLGLPVNDSRSRKLGTVVDVRWRHRETFVVAWDDVARVEETCITLRADFRRYSPRLKVLGGR